MHGRYGPQLLPELFGRELTPLVVTHGCRQIVDDVDFLARLSGGRHGSSRPLDATLAIGDRPVGLGPAQGRREHDVGNLGGPGHEHVLDDQHVETIEQGSGVGGVGFGVHWILTYAVDGLEFVATHGLEHLGEVPAVVRWDGAAPRRLELGSGLVVLHVLETGELVG